MDKQAVQIRPCREEYVEDCVRTALKAWEGIHDSYRELLGSELHDELMRDWREEKANGVRAQQQGENAFVAMLGDRVAGFIAYKVDREVGVITANAVDSDCRGHGIAKHMYEYVLCDMRQKGVRFVRVTTGGDDGHAPARRAYEKVGFEKALPSVTYYKAL